MFWEVVFEPRGVIVERLIIEHVRVSGPGCRVVRLAVCMTVGFLGDRLHTEFLGFGRLRQFQVAGRLNAGLRF